MQYSIADARNQLPQLVYRAQEGMPVELTRRGKPVAVLMSLEAYQRLTDQSVGFWDACEEFRQETAIDKLAIEPDLLANPRDPSPGRKVDW